MYNNNNNIFTETRGRRLESKSRDGGKNKIQQLSTKTLRSVYFSKVNILSLSNAIYFVKSSKIIIFHVVTHMFVINNCFDSGFFFYYDLPLTTKNESLRRDSNCKYPNIIYFFSNNE